MDILPVLTESSAIIMSSSDQCTWNIFLWNRSKIIFTISYLSVLAELYSYFLTSPVQCATWYPELCSSLLHWHSSSDCFQSRVQIILEVKTLKICDNWEFFHLIPSCSNSIERLGKFYPLLPRDLVECGAGDLVHLGRLVCRDLLLAQSLQSPGK